MERRLFEDLIDSDTKVHRTGRGKIVPVSIVLHLIGLALVLVVPLVMSDEIPDPTSVVKAFFVEPGAAASASSATPAGPQGSRDA